MRKKYIRFMIALLLLVSLIPGISVLADGGLVSSGTKEIAVGDSFTYNLNLASLSDEFKAVPYLIGVAGSNVNSATIGGVSASYDSSVGAYTVNSASLGGAQNISITVTFAAEATGQLSVTTTVANENGESSSGSLSVNVKGSEAAPTPPDEEGKGENEGEGEGEEPLGEEGLEGFGGFDFGGAMPYMGGSGGGSGDNTTVYHGSANNYLKSLEVSGIDLDPAFHKTNDTYFITVDGSTEKISVTAKAEETKAVAVVTGDTKLNPGTNKVLISVTAENDDVRYYRIYVTKEDK